MDQKNVVPPTLPTSETPPVQSNRVPKPSLPKILLFSLIALILIAASSLGTYFVVKSQLISKVPAPTPLPQITPSPTPDVTAWKTYTNTKRGYTFKYPENVKLTEEGNADVLTDPVTLSLWGPTQKANTELYDGLSLGFESGPLEGPTLKEFAEMSVKRSMENGTILIPVTPITIAGLNGYIYRVKGLGEHSYIFLPNPIHYQWYIRITNSTNDPTNQGFQKTVDQILYTFKFIDQNQQKAKPGVKTFTSEKLGISFTYSTLLQSPTNATEAGNKIFVYTGNQNPTQGQFVEVFQKNSGETLKAAIKKLLLAGKSEADCFVEDYKLTDYPSGFVGAQIGYPTDSNDNMETLEEKANKCSPGYAKSNGLSYFLEDTGHPNKFLFFSIGQYAIYSDENTLWQNTIKIID